MAVLGIDLGGTKLAFCLLDNNGKILNRIKIELKEKKGKEVGSLITEEVLNFHNVASSLGEKIDSIGISVPGIYHLSTGTVWAPNIPGWDDYPLLDEVKKVSKEIPVTIDSDRACYILGEFWKGNAQNCKNAIFLAVGTGIGAGILIEGNVLRGANDIAGAIGWMALDRPFKDEYISCGCFEHYASGEGIVKQARYFLQNEKKYSGELRNKSIEEMDCPDVFKAYENDDEIAIKIIKNCNEFWGMAAGNLVSLFNPEMIIFGGGVFGPAVPLIPGIKNEAAKWAQPISIKKVSFESSALAADAGVFGAGYLALKKINC